MDADWSTVHRPAKPGPRGISVTTKGTNQAPRVASSQGVVRVMMDQPGGGPDVQIEVPWGSDAAVGGPLREPLIQLRDAMSGRAPACCKVMGWAHVQRMWTVESNAL